MKRHERLLVRLGLRRPPRRPAHDVERLQRIYAQTAAEIEELRREPPPRRRAA
jgi:hypothetical protein